MPVPIDPEAPPASSPIDPASSVSADAAAEVAILRAAVREYQDAATEIEMVYREGEPGAAALLRRRTLLDMAALEMRETLRPLPPGLTRADMVRQAYERCFVPGAWMAAVRDDLLARLRGEPGRIPEMP